MLEQPCLAAELQLPTDRPSIRRVDRAAALGTVWLSVSQLASELVDPPLGQLSWLHRPGALTRFRTMMPSRQRRLQGDQRLGRQAARGQEGILPSLCPLSPCQQRPVRAKRLRREEVKLSVPPPPPTRVRVQASAWRRRSAESPWAWTRQPTSRLRGGWMLLWRQRQFCGQLQRR
jgi:hypothetical protein